MENQKQETPKPQLPDRHVFNVAINLNIIAPRGVDASALSKQIDEAIDKYLETTFKVLKIALPTRPGMPPEGFFYELRDKMEDIR